MHTFGRTDHLNILKLPDLSQYRIALRRNFNSNINQIISRNIKSDDLRYAEFNVSPIDKGAVFVRDRNDSVAHVSPVKLQLMFRNFVDRIT